MNSKSRFKEVMTRHDENDSVDDNLCRTLREFISCSLDALRFNKLTVKQSRENKYVHLSALPSHSKVSHLTC